MDITARHIAPFFIQKEVTHLKLQKLLYYSQVWYFVKYRSLLFQDRISAWKYGPVVNSIWKELKYTQKNSVLLKNRLSPMPLDNDIRSFLNEVWSIYGDLTSSLLVDLSHSEKPWLDKQVNNPFDVPSDDEIVISNNTVSQFKLNSFGKIPKIELNTSIGRIAYNA